MSILARSIAMATVLGGMLSIAACRQDPPPTEQPPEPQAAQTGLRDAIQAPQDAARAVEQTVQQGADAQRAQIDAAEAGG